MKFYRRTIFVLKKKNVFNFAIFYFSFVSNIHSLLSFIKLLSSSNTKFLYIIYLNKKCNIYNFFLNVTLKIEKLLELKIIIQKIFDFNNQFFLNHERIQ